MTQRTYIVTIDVDGPAMPARVVRLGVEERLRGERVDGRVRVTPAGPDCPCTGSLFCEQCAMGYSCPHHTPQAGEERPDDAGSNPSGGESRG